MFLIEPDKGNNYFLSDSSSFHFLSFSILLKSLYYEKRGSTGVTLFQMMGGIFIRRWWNRK